MRAFGGEAGPLTDEQVEDVVLYILENQEPVGAGEAEDAEGEADGEDADGAETPMTPGPRTLPTPLRPMATNWLPPTCPVRSCTPTTAWTTTAPSCRA